MSLTLDTLVAIATLVIVVTGLFLIFGLLHVINLAHTGLMAVGVYAEVSFRPSSPNHRVVGSVQDQFKMGALEINFCQRGRKASTLQASK